MAGKKETERQRDRKTVTEGIGLLPPAERAGLQGLHSTGEKEKVKGEEDVDMETATAEEQKIRVKLPRAKNGLAMKRRKQRLLVGSGPESMDVDS